jgi:hypothetical protein
MAWLADCAAARNKEQGSTPDLQGARPRRQRRVSADPLLERLDKDASYPWEPPILGSTALALWADGR